MRTKAIYAGVGLAILSGAALFMSASKEAAQAASTTPVTTYDETWDACIFDINDPPAKGCAAQHGTRYYYDARFFFGVTDQQVANAICEIYTATGITTVASDYHRISNETGGRHGYERLRVTCHMPVDSPVWKSDTGIYRDPSSTTSGDAIAKSFCTGPDGKVTAYQVWDRDKGPGGGHGFYLFHVICHQ
jgi:hypothetical protein